jgi:hypothetical protein
VRGLWGWSLMVLVACSSEGSDIAAEPASGTAVERELIPAEWTVAEDTSGSGEITTASVQLPTARDISGLLQDDTPRLVLRCLDGKVAAFIDTDPFDDAVTADSVLSAPLVRVELDAAPPCE